MLDIQETMDKIASRLVREFDDNINDQKTYALKVAAEIRAYCKELFEVRGTQKSDDEISLDKIRSMHGAL